MTPPHECLHEEQILGQSRKIERLGAELEYKKERLDELKEDNKRMESKLDDLSKDINNFINTSDAKDTKLDLRLTKIETRMEEQEKALKTAEEKRKEYENKAEKKRKEYQNNNDKAQQKNYQKLTLIFSLGMLIIAAITLGSRFIP